MQFPERLLPQDLLAEATLRGNEYAWPLADIPKVIEAAKENNLVSIGGQLQFRFPDGGTCECYWVQVDPHQTLPSDLPWAERVTRTAETALRDFRELQLRWDFISEGREAFAAEFEKWEAKGGDPATAMCFVWYVATLDDEAKIPAA